MAEITHQDTPDKSPFYIPGLSPLGKYYISAGRALDFIFMNPISRLNGNAGTVNAQLEQMLEEVRRHSALVPQGIMEPKDTIYFVKFEGRVQKYRRELGAMLQSHA